MLVKSLFGKNNKTMAKNKKKKTSPFGVNQALIDGAKAANYMTGGSTSLSSGEADLDALTDPIMDAIKGDYLGLKEKKKVEKPVQKEEKDKKVIKRNPNETNEENTTQEELNETLKNTDPDKQDQIDNDSEVNESNQNIKDLEENVKNATEEGNKEEIEKYNVELAKERFRLKNIFKKRNYLKEYEEGSDKRKEYRKNINVKRQELRNTKDPKKKDALREDIRKMEKTVNRKMLLVTMPDGSKQKMTRDEFLNLQKEKNITSYRGKKSDENRIYQGSYFSDSPTTAREEILSSSLKRKNSNGESPFAYKERINDNTPMYQVEEVDKDFDVPEGVVGGGTLPEVKIEGDAFDLMKKYGSANAEDYINEMQIIGDEKPPQLLGASASEAVTEFMTRQKEELNIIKQQKKGDLQSQEIINNVKRLSTNMNKIGDFIEEQITSIDEKSESNGSSVAGRYLRDVLLTKKTDEEGKPLTTMMVDNKNDLAIKFRDTEGIYSLNSIKKDIFPKAYKSFETLSQGMSSVKDEATSGLPFNEDAAKSLINNALKNEKEILSVVHDEESPFYQFLNDFADKFPNANMDFMHIDSPNYSPDDLSVLVKDYALRKFMEQYKIYSPKQKNEDLTPEQLIEKYS
jgi:ribosomal protein S8